MAKNKNLFVYLFFFALSLSSAFCQSSLRDNVAKIYTSQLGVREKTGRNDGKEVEAYLKYVGLTKGQPWCASFVCWTYGQAGIANPRAGGCAYLMERGQLVYKAGKNLTGVPPQQADAFFIYFPEKGRVAHTGFVHIWGTDWVETVEGNTNQAGSREGDGVYRKRRLKRQIYAVANYIKPKP